MTTKNRPAFTAGLRAVADFLDAHPEVPLPYLGFGGIPGNETPTLDIYLHTEDDQKMALAAVARAMGTANKVAKEWSNGSSSFMVWREFGGIALCASAERDQVCTRVVTGAEDREVEEVVTPAVTRTVTRPVEVVEWRCLPLLAPDAAEVAGSAIQEDPAGVADAVIAGVRKDEAVPSSGPLCAKCGSPGPLKTRGNGMQVCEDTGACGRRVQAAKAGTCAKCHAEPRAPGLGGAR